MTREEAIGNLNMIRVAFIDTVTAEQGKLIDDTFRAAIEALKKESKLQQALEQEKGAYNALVANVHCEDAISRSDMLDAIGHSMSYTSEDLQKIIKALPPVNPQPYEDAISREDALMCLTGEWTEITDEIIHRFIKRIKALSPVNPQSKAEQFAKWVAGEIFDDMWEYNKDAFAEIACRKLAKLGIVIRMGDEWELIEPQDVGQENCNRKI